ncbi:site-2 protease family protein [Calycomorphotria hydatis]|nr:site-2 protease family protein [Calycomorphotria hydatis]
MSQSEDPFYSSPQPPVELITSHSNGHVTTGTAEKTKRTRRNSHIRRWGLHLGLFIATCISVFIVGMVPGSMNLDFLTVLYAYFTSDPALTDIRPFLFSGLIYGACLMGTLLAHEFGHYLAAKFHRVWATLPFFIPFPLNPFGTMGAVIVQAGRDADRKQLFDIAIAGPLAGLVIALPVAWYGVSISEIQPFPPGQPQMVRWGDPLVLQAMVTVIHRPYDTSVEDITINAPLFAGWVGIFITALNLMPLGQLDGGHILYALVGRKQHWIAAGLMLLAFSLMVFFGQFVYMLMLMLVFFMGYKHPRTRDDHVPLGWFRVILGWLTLAFLLVGFSPMPFIA